MAHAFLLPVQQVGGGAGAWGQWRESAFLVSSRLMLSFWPLVTLGKPLLWWVGAMDSDCPGSNPESAAYWWSGPWRETSAHAVFPVWTVTIIAPPLSVVMKAPLFSTHPENSAWRDGTLPAVLCLLSACSGTACWESRSAGFLHWRVMGCGHGRRTPPSLPWWLSPSRGPLSTSLHRLVAGCKQ